MKSSFCIITALLAILIGGLPGLAGAGMSSAHYAIPTSVMSGGGSPMSSAGFKTNASLGQSSPLTMTASTAYDLYPGFWYTLSTSMCIWDLDPVDGDVDGLDLQKFIHPPYFSPPGVESFGSEFGRTDCL